MTATDVLRDEVKHNLDKVGDRCLRIVNAILEIEIADQEDGEDWESLPQELQVILNRAIEESEEGKTTPHAEVVKQYSQWFRK